MALKRNEDRPILQRDGSVGAFDVQRAADALLRQGIKPSVAAIRQHLGGGSPNTITPLLARYWEGLGRRLGDGPESLERMPESLARAAEVVWRRALEEAGERLRILATPGNPPNELQLLQDQITKLSAAIAEARGREGEQLAHLAVMSRERETLRQERASLLAALKGAQALLAQQTERVKALEDRQAAATSKAIAAYSPHPRARKSARPPAARRKHRSIARPK
jgi:hypothetical protein